MALLTQKQKSRITAMSADGASVSDIAAVMSLETTDVEAVLGHRGAAEQPTEKPALEGFEVVVRKERKPPILPLPKEKREEIRRLLSEKQQTQKKIAALVGVSAASVARINREMKVKEPAAAATATDSKEKSSHGNNSTHYRKSQALRGVEVIGLMQTMLIGIEENFGDNVEVMSLRADSDTAGITFRYGDNACTLSYCYTEGNLFCYILGEKQDKPLPKYEDENRRRLEQVQRVKEVEEQARRLREAFVKAYTSKRRNYTYALRMMLDMELELVDTNWGRVSELLDIDVPDDDIPESGDFIGLCVTDPDKVMLAVTASLAETGFYTSVHTWDGSHQRNEYLEKWYKWLGLMGYNISDDEKAMLNGTHECFGNNEEEN